MRLSYILPLLSLVSPLLAAPKDTPLKIKEVAVEGADTVKKAAVKGADAVKQAAVKGADTVKEAVLSVAAMTSETAAEPTFQPTIFNGEEVPPMRELSGTTIKEEIKQGYWYVVARF